MGAMRKDGSTQGASLDDSRENSQEMLKTATAWQKRYAPSVEALDEVHDPGRSSRGAKEPDDERVKQGRKSTGKIKASIDRKILPVLLVRSFPSNSVQGDRVAKKITTRDESLLPLVNTSLSGPSHQSVAHTRNDLVI